MKAAKEVRGWLGVHPMDPRPELDLDEDSYVHKPLTALEQNVLNAKMMLMTTSYPETESLYDHMASLVAKVLETKLDNPADNLERLSSQLKNSRTRTPCNFQETDGDKRQSEFSRAEWTLFKAIARPMPNAEPEIFWPSGGEEAAEELLCLPNLMRQAHLFNVCGMGLSSAFYVRAALALRELAETWPLVSLRRCPDNKASREVWKCQCEACRCVSCEMLKARAVSSHARHYTACAESRLWGVLHGLRGDYTIAEGELREGEYDTDISENEDDESPQQSGADTNLKDDIDSEEIMDDVKPAYKPPWKIPCEPPGCGLNKKVYFVCSQPGMPWTRLPHVSPSQINTARRIRKYFTGDLDHQLKTFPPFPGTEKNYLRAQIARISASTHISPNGVFKFEEEGDDEAETPQGARDTFIADPDFPGLSLRDLTDPSLMSWVHHAPFILPQGRATWFNPVARDKGEEEEVEERNEPDEPAPELGPPLLTPTADDVGVTDRTPAWIARASSRLVPEYALAYLQSTVWPGAVAVAADKGRFFENLYVGWGQKCLPNNFDPAMPEFPMEEFPTGPEVIEAEDPSPETEAAIRAAMREQGAANEEEDDDVEEGIMEDDNDGADLSD